MCMDELAAFKNVPRQLLQWESVLLKVANTSWNKTATEMYGLIERTRAKGLTLTEAGRAMLPVVHGKHAAGAVKPLPVLQPDLKTV